MVKTRQAIHFIAVNYRGALVGAEIGIETGIHAQNILETLNIRTLYLVDVELHPSLHKCISVVKNRTKIMIMSSTDAADMVTEKLDFVYIDANHRHAPVLQDIYSWYPKIRPYGVLCGHDYQLQLVKGAVEKFGKEIGSAVNIMSNESAGTGIDWWILKQREI